MVRDRRGRRRGCGQGRRPERAHECRGTENGHAASQTNAMTRLGGARAADYQPDRATANTCTHFAILTAFRAPGSAPQAPGASRCQPQHRPAALHRRRFRNGYHRSVCSEAAHSCDRPRKNPGGGAGDRTRVRSRVPCDIYERSPGIDLTRAAPWDQARLRPASVYVPPGAEAPPGGEAACINVGSGSHSREAGRRQAEA